jgi:poly(3-hydroxybutyrate) depolymerase
MRSLSDTLERLARVRAIESATPTGSILKKLDQFGGNPDALAAWQHVPNRLSAAPALVVVLHGCTQTAAGYDAGSVWSALAEDKPGCCRQRPPPRPIWWRATGSCHT